MKSSQRVCGSFIWLKKLTELNRGFSNFFYKLNNQLGNNPDSKAIYSKVHEKIERVSKLFDLIFFKFQIGMIMVLAIPRMILNHYIFDGADDSFDLPIQVWCVQKIFVKGN